MDPLVEPQVNSNAELLKELSILTAETLIKEKLNLDSKSDIVPVLRIVMEVIEERELKGEQQKHLAKMILQKVIIDSSMTTEQKELSLDLVNNGLIDNTITLISDATKGKIKINKKKVKEGCINALIKYLTDFNKQKSQEKPQEKPEEKPLNQL